MESFLNPDSLRTFILLLYVIDFGFLFPVVVPLCRLSYLGLGRFPAKLGKIGFVLPSFLVFRSLGDSSDKSPLKVFSFFFF